MSYADKFAKKFDNQNTDSKIKKYFDENNLYASNPNPSKKPYTVVIPPPNITGVLHLGHILNNTLQDILVRWHRSTGYEACWVPGCDHASIATEAKVTAKLKKEGIHKKEIGREAFLDHAKQWKDKHEHIIYDQLKTLGCSLDWDRSTFTMDDKYFNAVIKAIVKLYNDGLIYRGKKLVNWCPVSQSVISNEEVINEDRNGSLWHMRYPLEDNPKECLVLATTRPETLFGDQAVAVHPKDERYQHLIGKNVILPVVNKPIPVIADEYVDKEFGTGVVKITPAHDPNDYEVGKRHNLKLFNVMNPNASMNDNAPKAYVGLDRYDARKKLVAELKDLGLLEKTEPHKLVIGISERGQVPIEYYLSDQWYIKMDKLAQLALDATKSQRLSIMPPHMEKTWDHWLGNIQDWCISRQLWWGHRIPIYECTSCGKHTAAETQPETCSHCGHTDLKQDEDVLDTWASSWLWPFGTFDWADAPDNEELKYYYPTECIVTGYDIIFFWIARMVMAGEYFTEKTPFNKVYFTGLIRDAQGRKMSKSLGNSPDVFQIMKDYGTDALRYTVTQQCHAGMDTNWKTENLEVGRNFSNKIWNATRFLMMNCDRFGVKPEQHTFQEFSQLPDDALLSWIVSEFYTCVEKCHKAIEKYEFSQLASSLYEFTWMVYCDWFVELIKPRLNESADAQTAKNTLTIALQIHDGLLRLLNPIMPYITEDIWQTIDSNRSGKTVNREAMPLPAQAGLVDRKAIEVMRSVQQVVGAVRGIRGQFTLHPGAELKASLNIKAETFGNLIGTMEQLAKAKFSFQGQKPKVASTAVVDNFEVYVDLEGHVDAEAEKKRLESKVKKVQNVIGGIEKKLSNERFVNGAPEHIVAGAKKQLEENQAELNILKRSLTSLG